MARLKPTIKIPYKRYEKSFNRAEDSNGQEEGFVVLKDITANPSIATTNLKHGRNGEEMADEQEPEAAQDEPKKNSGKQEVTLNKKIKIRRKHR